MFNYQFLSTGTIPGTFTKLVNLRFLYLQNNVLEGTGAISAIPKVYRQSVDLSYNFFNGEIPFNTTDERIRSLYVRNNQFSGSLPTDFSFVASVEILDLSFNRLTGTLPKELNMVRFRPIPIPIPIPILILCHVFVFNCLISSHFLLYSY